MRNIIWTTTASAEYDGNIDYLIKKWNVVDALNFINNVEAILFNLKAGIVEYPLTVEGYVRKCVVCKQITLFYQVTRMSKRSLTNTKTLNLNLRKKINRQYGFQDYFQH